MGKKVKLPDLANLTEHEERKLEIAEEIGVYDKVIHQGWRSLSARESGKIGGILSRRKREEKEREKRQGNETTGNDEGTDHCDHD
ncbi:MAG: small, acid-soluble spore protein, alpha/beta type [Clostridiales bacterium]|nr:small, acid-soluble spore protein, alpha/beta type [Clostridiales bacterium]